MDESRVSDLALEARQRGQLLVIRGGVTAMVDERAPGDIPVSCAIKRMQRVRPSEQPEALFHAPEAA